MSTVSSFVLILTFSFFLVLLHCSSLKASLSQQIMEVKNELAKPIDHTVVKHIHQTISSGNKMLKLASSRDVLQDFQDKHLVEIHRVDKDLALASTCTNQGLVSMLKAAELLNEIVENRSGNHVYRMERALEHLDVAGEELDKGENHAEEAFQTVETVWANVSKKMLELKLKILEREKQYRIVMAVRDIFTDNGQGK